MTPAGGRGVRRGAIEWDPMWDPEDDLGEPDPELEMEDAIEELVIDKFMHLGRAKRGKGAKVEREQIHWSMKARVANRDLWRCFYCGLDLSDGSGHFDHKTPVTKGGRTTAMNLVYCCPRCNTRKQTMTAAEYLDLIADETMARVSRAAAKRSR